MKFNLLDSLVVVAAPAMIAAALLCCGCTVTRYEAPSGERFTRSSFGTRLQVSELTVTAGSNGVRSITMRGYANDQIEGLKAVTEAAVTAAVKSAKP